MNTEKDLTSYHRHDQDYKNLYDIGNLIDAYEKDGINAQFESAGYTKILAMFPSVRGVHVDIGCGGGWLLVKTSPFFRRVIGVDPSADALRVARDITKNISNIELVHSDMTDVFKNLSLQEPVFITTATVLSHIQDWYVESFLKYVNNLPQGSILLFGEPYGGNIHRRLWYVRSKRWWAKALSDWQLVFVEDENKKQYGIGGVKVGSSQVLNAYHMRTWEKFEWALSGAYFSMRTFFANLYQATKRLTQYFYRGKV